MRNVFSLIKFPFVVIGYGFKNPLIGLKWFALIWVLFIVLFIGAFREKYNIIIETEEQTHQRVMQGSLEAEADYYLELQNNLEGL